MVEMPWYRDIRPEAMRERHVARGIEQLRRASRRRVYLCNICRWVGYDWQTDVHAEKTGHRDFASDYMGGRGWRERMEKIVAKEIPFPKKALNYKPSQLEPLPHCPQDCTRQKTCYRGQPLPYDKNICYVQEKPTVVDVYDSRDKTKMRLHLA